MKTSKRPRGLISVMALSWLAWSTAEAGAQLQIRIGGEHPGASVRFGEPAPRTYAPGPVQFVPVPQAPPASIRYEHYHEQDRDHFREVERRPGWDRPREAYRNPYNDVYARRFYPGYRPVLVGSTQYVYYPALPANAQSVIVGGATYYTANGIFYQPYIYQGQTVFMVVPSPIP